jgi:3D (Asp-Asp-Asp) domain-containing protein/peptidoglycan hydrolase CwlO-like protein
LAATSGFLVLLGAPAAFADDPGQLRTRAETLRAQNDTLEAQAHEALLELYSLETRLARAEQRLAALQERTAEVERQTERARVGLEIARDNLQEADRRLASRLQTLYVEGSVDPLAVLLGAESLDEALSALDGLDRLAADDGAIIDEVRTSRERLEASLARLRERRAELDALLADAEDTRAALAGARSERAAYLGDLRSRQTFNRGLIGDLLARAAAAEARSAQIATPEPVAADTVSSSVPAPEPAAAPPPVPPAVGGATTSAPASGGRLTVSSTGYCLRGATATGMRTGWGTIAVDPAVIPLGTRMSVPGYGDGVAADTGAAVRGHAIDLWFPTCDQALEWGRRTVTITLY